MQQRGVGKCCSRVGSEASAEIELDAFWP